MEWARPQQMLNKAGYVLYGMPPSRLEPKANGQQRPDCWQVRSATRPSLGGCLIELSLAWLCPNPRHVPAQPQGRPLR